MALFSKINKELITDIIDTEVYYYKVIVEDTKQNLYGEGKNKVYYNPVKIPTLIDRTNAEAIFDEFGSSYTRNVNFYFLRDTLVEKNIFPELGDVIEWNDEQHEIARLPLSHGKEAASSRYLRPQSSADLLL